MGSEMCIRDSYKKKMKDNLIDIFNQVITDNTIDETMINIKASTTESLGYIGRGEGITCYCITSLVNA